MCSAPPPPPPCSRRQAGPSPSNRRRRVADERGEGQRIRGRAVRQRGRALRRARFRLGAGRGRQPASDGRSGPPRGRLGPSQRADLRRRSRSTVRLRVFIGRPSRRRRAHQRLGEGLWFARGHDLGRALLQRPVRPQARAPVGAQPLREVHRRDGARAEPAAPPRQAPRPADPRLRDVRDPGIPAPDARFRRRRQARAAARRPRLQPLRDVRDARESLRPARPGGSGADAPRLAGRAYDLHRVRARPSVRRLEGVRMTLSSWLPWALLSALFAALTAIFAKVGIDGIDSDFATLFRTAVVAVTLGALVYATGKWQSPFEIQPKSALFLVLSALATGASWVCYFRALKVGDASKVAPVDKLSVVLVAVFAVMFLGERPGLREWLGIGLVGGGVLLLR